MNPKLWTLSQASDGGQEINTVTELLAGLSMWSGVRWCEPGCWQ